MGSVEGNCECKDAGLNEMFRALRGPRIRWLAVVCKLMGLDVKRIELVEVLSRKLRDEEHLIGPLTALVQYIKEALLFIISFVINLCLWNENVEKNSGNISSQLVIFDCCITSSIARCTLIKTIEYSQHGTTVNESSKSILCTFSLFYD